ncbi:MAG TPA: hypothetical protein H9832_07135 [Candidatus Agathobaculum merdavium]|nr:hypothetical protein [Candidatus Agathobaculum merdavium]
METIRDYWAQLSAALAAAVWVVKAAIKRRKHRAEWERAVQKALLATLHDRLLFLCLHYLEAGEITADELDNLTLLYDQYVALGGNGTIKKLMERVGIYVKIIDERSKNNELEG